MSHVFISYSRKDSERVDELVEKTEDAGFEIWIDREDIRGGRMWDNTIGKALISAAVVLLVLSRNSVKSDNVQNEVALAIERKVPIVPVAIEDVDIPDGLSLHLVRIQRIDLERDGFESVVAALGEYINVRKTSRVEPEADTNESQSASPLPELTSDTFQRLLSLTDGQMGALRLSCEDIRNKKIRVMTGPLAVHYSEAKRIVGFEKLDNKLCASIELAYMIRASRK